MSFLTNGLPSLAQFSGQEELPVDTNVIEGAVPQQSKIALYKLALLLTTMLNTLSKTMVAGSIYYTQFNIGASSDLNQESVESFVLNGVNIPVGTGGTDTWYVGLYNSAGVLVASGSTSGVTAGTSNTVQQIPFCVGTTPTPTAPLPSGTYYIALQSNGTTASFKAINSPIWPFVTGSQTGVAGTLAKITPPSTYTANLGPAASLY